MTTQQLITSDHPKGRQATDLFRAAYNNAALDEDRAQRLNERGGEFQAYIQAGIHRYSAKAPDYELAKTILGKDFISPEEIAARRGLTYSDELFAAFGQMLPDEEGLVWCRDNGMPLFGGPPRSKSLLGIRGLNPAYFYSTEGGWYAKDAETFSRLDLVEPIWIALRKEPVAGSLSQDWPTQRPMVTNPAIIPNAAEAAWCLTTYKAVRGVDLSPGIYVRTSSCDSHGNRVYVGFDDGRLSVYDIWDSVRDSDLGVSAARQFC